MNVEDTQTSNGKPDNIHRDPSMMPFWDIIRSLNTGQFCALLLFAAGVFGAGFGFGQWENVINNDRKLLQLGSEHRVEVRNKDAIIDELKRSLLTEKKIKEDAVRFVKAANLAAHQQRAKAEFQQRYLSYLNERDPGGAMHKLFVDHVCVLWRETQRDIHTIRSDTFTLWNIGDGRPLTEEALQAFSKVGIGRDVIEEYFRLNQSRTSIQPRNGFPSGSKFQRLQRLESELRSKINKGVTTKTVTFFDGTGYVIPLSIAKEVHLRGDCNP